MNQIDAFVARCERYAKAAGLEVSTVSLKLFNDGKKIDALKGGAGMTLRVHDAAVAKLAALEARLSQAA